MIKQTVFLHGGGFYEYRMHSAKIDKVKNFPSLKNYLYKVLTECPDKYFHSGPRSSMLKFNVGVKVAQAKGHEMSLLTKHALQVNKGNYNGNHERVENFLLENDNKTIAIEVPLWIFPNELAGFNELFKSKEPLTGHIDLLGFDNNKIWIWDYKPNAHKEKFAATQTLFYAIMLSKRTNIPLDNFRCGYFDDKFAFIFEPKDNLLPNSNLTEFF